MTLNKVIRVAVDMTMTVLFFVLMSYHVADTLVHEILGAALFLLTIVHNILNRRWYGALLKGRYTPGRRLHTAVNLLFLAALVCLVASAVAVSRHLFAFMGIRGICGPGGSTSLPPTGALYLWPSTWVSTGTAWYGLPPQS
ncbi:hypothetical protein K7I13_03825 [Brucepastera parasyntrophica]|uniref:hypothetical protein n=1 Tax=Brucepastera parasyntrophica TaxID=2880008 RepID=UPI0021087AF6|nr:hypothetical protein [Brucepastera parasyntrophica]ULQ60448.1 hypothetical protein K7I13_03825 [Brucepastera parasyntrophica]